MPYAVFLWAVDSGQWTGYNVAHYLMKFTKLEIPDLVLVEPDVHRDSRGFFFESYREDEFVKNGLPPLKQDNHSLSVKGVLRGLHFQRAPHAQAKLIRAIRGEIFDVAVDVRKFSPTYGKHIHIHLTAENKKMLYVPAGFAHGYCVLKDDTEVLYKVSDYYAPQSEGGLFWNDPALQIPWPKLDIPYVLNPRDQKFPLLKDLS